MLLQLVHVVAVEAQVTQFSLQLKQTELFNPVSYNPVLQLHVELRRVRVLSQVRQLLADELQVKHM